MPRTLSSSRKARPQDSGDVDTYLKTLPADARAALQKLRVTIGAAAPDAREGFSYGLPAFRLEGRPLVCYGASKDHCSFYPMSPAVIRGHELDLRGFDTSKGTIRFSPDEPLPSTLVRKLVKARIAELRKAKK